MPNTTRNSSGTDHDDGRRNPETPIPLESQDSTLPSLGMERKKRARTGCVNCSRRRRKCDEVKPTCTGCRTRGDDCQWRKFGSFRESNIKVLESDHPSMSRGVAASKTKFRTRFRILKSHTQQTRSCVFQARTCTWAASAPYFKYQCWALACGYDGKCLGLHSSLAYQWDP